VTAGAGQRGIPDTPSGRLASTEGAAVGSEYSLVGPMEGPGAADPGWGAPRACGCVVGYVVSLALLPVGLGVAVITRRAIVSPAPVSAVLTALPPVASQALGVALVALCLGLGMKLAYSWLLASLRGLLRRLTLSHPVAR
jgi:hypothetical protein